MDHQLMDKYKYYKFIDKVYVYLCNKPVYLKYVLRNEYHIRAAKSHLSKTQQHVNQGPIRNIIYITFILLSLEYNDNN